MQMGIQTSGAWPLPRELFLTHLGVEEPEVGRIMMIFPYFRTPTSWLFVFHLR